MNKSIVLTDKKRNMIFINIVITCIALTMLSTALTTALPAIVNDLGISVTTGQWLTSGYALSMAIVMPLTAFLITRFPTKKLYITGLVIALIGLLLCAISPNFPMMMMTRILQAVGNGLLTSMAQVILLSIYPIEKRGAIMGWYGLSLSAAPVIAPTIAGLIVDKMDWPAIFYLASVIIVLSLIWSIIVFDDLLATKPQKFDSPSFVLSALAFGGVTLAIGNIGHYAFFSPQVLLLLLIGGAGTLAFIYRQLKSPQPFLELRILSNRNYALSVLGSMLLYLVMMAATMLLPLYVQSVLGKSATLSGLLVLPGSLIMAFISPFAGKLYDKVGIKPLFVFGACGMLISNLGMVFISMSTPIWVAAGYNMLRCIAIGCLMMPLVTWGTSYINPELTAHGTALLTSLRTVSGAIGTAVFVGIMTTVSQHSVSSYGSDAAIHGLNIAFLWMSGVSLLLLLMGIIFVKKDVLFREGQLIKTEVK